MPDLKCILLSSPDHFMDLQRLNNPEGSFTVTWYKYILKLYYQFPITINYDNTIHLTMLHDYNGIYSTVESLFMILFSPARIF